MRAGRPAIVPGIRKCPETLGLVQGIIQASGKPIGDNLILRRHDDGNRIEITRQVRYIVITIFQDPAGGKKPVQGLGQVQQGIPGGDQSDTINGNIRFCQCGANDTAPE